MFLLTSRLPARRFDVGRWLLPLLLCVSVASSMRGAVAQLPIGRSYLSRVTPVDDRLPTRTLTRDVAGLPWVSAANGGNCAPVLASGWPVSFPSDTSFGFDPMRGAALADLDLDGRLEVVRPSTDGQLYAFHHDGRAVAGFPVPLVGLGQEAPAIADLDGDGWPEIVVNTRGVTQGGAVHVFGAGGRLRAGWPVSLGGNNVVGSPLCVDLDGDGDLEIVVQERIGQTGGRLHALHHDARAVAGAFPYQLDHVPAGSPATADLDGDGRLDLVTISFHSLHALRADGRSLPGFPIDVALRWRAAFSYQSPAIGDIDGDGRPDIVVACHGAGAGCYAFDAAGQPLLGWPFSFGGTWTFSPPALADLDGDGFLDVIVGRGGQALTGPALHALDGRASPLRGFPVTLAGGSEAPLAIADLDLDGQLEVIFDSNLADSSGQGLLHCYDALGRPEPGWPLRVPGYSHLNGVQLGDLDGDGRLELCAVTRRSGVVAISVFAVGCGGRPQPVAWGSYQAGAARRGLAGELQRFEVRGRATPGGVLHMQAAGPPLTFWVALGAAGAGRVPLGSPAQGALLLDPATTVTLTASFLSAEGRGLWSYPLPNDPALRGAELFLQGGVFDHGVMELGAMRRLRVR